MQRYILIYQHTMQSALMWTRDLKLSLSKRGFEIVAQRNNIIIVKREYLAVGR